jgi:anthranilate synthase component 2
MKILILDNYDSFTYNLYQYIKELTDATIAVHRNDQISVDSVAEFDGIILSPGPGLPKDAGIMPEVIKRYAPSKPILGVCLGHQAIAEAFGATLYNLPKVYHGVSTPIHVTDFAEPLFKNIPNQLEVGRYHSWAVDTEGQLPACLRVTAVSADGAIMALSHTQYFVKGVQFHPESVMTPYGKQMLSNFLQHFTTSVRSNAVQYVF